MNLREAGVLIITVLLYVALFTGLYLLMKRQVNLMISRFNSHKRLRERKRSRFAESRLDSHLGLLIQSVIGRQVSPRVFKTIIAVLFIGIMAIGYGNISLKAAILLAAILSSLPYLMLRIRLETIRRKGSFEGETLISSFLSQYRIKQFNIYETIEGVLAEGNDLKLTKKLLFRLLIAIRNTGSETAVNEAVKSFSFAINTNWSRMLANCIKTAAIRGINISLALEDILIQLREARTLAEERKRLNSEAVRMTIFMVPIMYIATIVMSVNYMEMPVRKLIQNQFYTTEGFTLFLLTLFLFLINLMLIEMIQHKRFDY